jgi:hypothetical protein
MNPFNLSLRTRTQAAVTAGWMDSIRKVVAEEARTIGVVDPAIPDRVLRGSVAQAKDFAWGTVH